MNKKFPASAGTLTLLLASTVLPASPSLAQSGSSTNCVPAPSNLVSWWRAEGNAQDAVNGNNGTLLSDTTFGPGEVGQALSINASGAGVDCGSPTNLQLQDFTIEAWIKRGSSTKATWDIYNHGHIVSWVWGGFGLGLFDTGQLFLDKVGYSVVNTTNTITDSTAFHHVAVTKSGSNVVLYIDGLAEPMPAYDPGFVFNGTFCIGTRGSDHVTSFLGLIDEASVYSRALSSNEIQAIYLAGAAGKCPTINPPVITTQPADATVLAGQTATFSVTATGDLPLSYQWLFNTNPLNNQTNSSLVLSNVQSVDGGYYSVVVSNAAGSVVSSNALLTVLPNTTNCIPPPAGLISWWRAEDNTQDAIGGNNGTLLPNTTFGPGEVNQAFSINASGGGVDCGSPTNLQVQDFTIEAWIKRGSSTKATWDVYNHGHIVSWVWGGFGLGLFDTGQLFLDKVGYSGVNTTNTITDTTAFHHVAVTKSGSNVVLYIDGLAEPMPAYDPGFVFNGTFCIGTRGSDHVTSFLGLVDEASVYSRALSSSEIQALYEAGAAGKCVTPQPPVITTQPTDATVLAGQTATFTVVASGAPPLYYQWLSNNTALFAETNSSLVLNDVQVDYAGYYSVIVSNAVGSVLSSNALLTVVPTTTNCVAPPAGLISWWRAEDNTQDAIGGNNGTLLPNTTFGAGEAGQAFSINGSGAGVDCGSPTNLQVQDFTIEAWIKRGSSTKATWDVYNHGQIAAWVWGGFGMGMYDSGQLFLTKVGYTSVVSTGTLTDTNNFHHVAATKSGSNVVLYIDGVGEPMPPFDPGFVFNGTFCIGTRGSDHVTSFLGLVDEASVYARALSPDEVQAIYAAGRAGKCTSPPPPPVCLPPPTNLVSWWRAEGDAQDAVSGNNGTLLSGTTFAPGQVGLAFHFDGVSNGVRVAATPNLDVGQSGGLTLEAWVNPTDAGNGHPVIEWSQDVGGAPYGVHLWIGHPSQPPGYFYANIADTAGNWHVIDSAPGLIQSNVFQHIAVTYDKSSGLARLFLNGAVVKETNLGVFTPQTSYNLYFGERPPGDINSRFFAGLIDEISVYNRPLGTNEIQAIYNAGTAGKCALNQPPVAGNVFIRVIENEVFKIPTARFLAFCSDPDHDPLVISSVSPTSTNGASVTLDTNWVFYAAPTNYHGSDRFDFTVSDGHGNTATAYALIQIEPRRFAAATIVQPITSGGTVQLNFNGVAGHTYTIQRAESLNGPWMTLGTVGTDNSGIASFVDPNPPAVNAYYRAVFQ